MPSPNLDTKTAKHQGSTIGLLLLGLIVVSLLGLLFGAGSLTPVQSVSALISPSGGNAQATIWFVRAPRVVLAALVGAALAVAGAIMQLATRNPLASPQTLGLNGVAALAMVIAIVTGSSGPLSILPGTPALLGAIVGGAIIVTLVLGPLRGPVPLALAGMSIHLLCTALIEAFAVLNDAAVDVIFWLTGSVAGAQWMNVREALPWIGIGLILALSQWRTLHVVAMGRDQATALGENFTRSTAIAIGIVVLLVAGSVTAAGPIGFVGLIVPHLVRKLGPLTQQLPLCAVAGATLLVAADVAARLIRWPAETPVGVLTAVIGAPLFLFLVRRARLGGGQ